MRNNLETLPDSPINLLFSTFLPFQARALTPSRLVICARRAPVLVRRDNGNEINHIHEKRKRKNRPLFEHKLVVESIFSRRPCLRDAEQFKHRW